MEIEVHIRLGKREIIFEFAPHFWTGYMFWPSGKTGLIGLGPFAVIWRRA